MRSSELAELAGVTVRTLRHYHQIGLLAEPPRTGGGYRHYDVGHLVRLLRIRRMTGLGIPLSALPAVLDDPAAADRLLDQIDLTIAEQIDELTARRATIAALRRAGAPPDLPPELSAWGSTPGQGISPERARYEHEQVILLGHLLGPDGPASLAALLGDAGGVVSDELVARFYAVDANTPDADIEAVVGELATAIEPITDRFADLPTLTRQAAVLVEELNTGALGPTQRRILRLLQERLAPAPEP